MDFESHRTAGSQKSTIFNISFLSTNFNDWYIIYVYKKKLNSNSFFSVLQLLCNLVYYCLSLLQSCRIRILWNARKLPSCIHTYTSGEIKFWYTECSKKTYQTNGICLKKISLISLSNINKKVKNNFYTNEYGCSYCKEEL